MITVSPKPNHHNSHVATAGLCQARPLTGHVAGVMLAATRPIYLLRDLMQRRAGSRAAHSGDGTVRVVAVRSYGARRYMPR